MSSRKLSQGEHLITTEPTATTCFRCGRPVLAATVGGIDTHVDLATLNDEGELMALFDSRTTYGLIGERLFVRNVTHIGGARSYPVLAAHACRDVPERHIDHVWDEVAVVLASSILGAVAVLPDEPTF